MTVAERMADLFRGRTDAYGAVEGRAVKEPVDLDVWEWHLGAGSIGIYPIVHRDQLPVDDAERIVNHEVATGQKWGNWMVHWGCTDLDKGYVESWPDAINLCRCLQVFGVTPWLERTKSKGWHVWVFATEWVPAEVMRRALLAAHQIVGVPPVEVNPKQTGLTGSLTLGNYVNVPYPSGHGDRRVIHPPSAYLDDIGDYTALAPMPVTEFVEAADKFRAPFDTLYKAALLYTPPKRMVAPDMGVGYSGELAPLVSRLPGLAYKIFVDGVLEGRDRSRTLVRLAHLLVEAGWAPAEVKAIIVDADSRFGKYADRRNADQLYDQIVAHAYTSTTVQDSGDQHG